MLACVVLTFCLVAQSFTSMHDKSRAGSVVGLFNNPMERLPEATEWVVQGETPCTA
jgi:hypothetical protein